MTFLVNSIFSFGDKVLKEERFDKVLRNVKDVQRKQSWSTDANWPLSRHLVCFTIFQGNEGVYLSVI